MSAGSGSEATKKPGMDFATGIALGLLVAMVVLLLAAIALLVLV